MTELSWTQRYKCICLGEWAVGKTSIIKRFCDGMFSSSYLPTIGCDFSTKIVKLKEESVKLVIWDLAGQILFASFRRDFYEGANGALLIFDVTRPETLSKLHEWFTEAVDSCGRIPFVVCGNKIDLESRVSRNQVQKFAEELNAPLIFTSAKTGENIEETFALIAESIHFRETRTKTHSSR